MPSYPTESRHGSNGYRRGATAGLSSAGTIPVETAFLAPAAGPLAQYGHGLAVGETAAEQATLRAWLSRFPVVARVPVGVAAAGFLAGWEVGAYFLGREDLSLIPWGMITTGSDPDPNADPARWSNPAWGWYPCTGPFNASGPIVYKIANSQSICASNDIGIGIQGGSLWSDPKTAVEHITFHEPKVGVYLNGTSGFRRRMLGSFDPTGAEPDEWLFDGEPLTAVTPGYFAPAEPWTVDPNDLPIMQPVTTPVPRPFDLAVADPATQPDWQTTNPAPVVPEFVTVPMPAFPTNVTLPPVVLVPPGVARPDGTTVPLQPATQVVTAPDGGGVNVIQVPETIGTPSPEPPGRRDRKIHVKTVVGPQVHAVLNVVTETFDFIDTLYKGVKDLVPRNEWCANHDYKCKLAQLYDHWDDPNFDVAKWVSAFINNQLEDMLFGMIGQQVGGATGRLGITTGLSRALGAGGDQEVKLDENGNEIETDTTGLLPELVLTDEGWGIEWKLIDGGFFFNTVDGSMNP